MTASTSHTKPKDTPGRLRICLLSYRSNPHCGGQGVYLNNLSRGLKDLGHSVQVVSGPPDPRLDADIPVWTLPGLDLYNPADPFRIPSLKELANPINLAEWMGVATMGFPEPFTFGLRAYQLLRSRWHDFDVIHDNQSLSYGIWAMNKFVPIVATIHHPITVDRAIAVQTAPALWKKFKQLRWYSFVGMQKRVSRRLSHIITVSKSARNDICRDFRIPKKKLRVVPNGINTEQFYPISGIAKDPGGIITTNSADIPLKGLYYLLLAVARIARKREVRLVVVGRPKKNGDILKLIHTLGIGSRVKFTGRLDNGEFVRQYARATVAVVPSMYEGFGLPAGEAMACGIPVVSTTGGALPEVVGDAGILVPPADPTALAREITNLLDHPDRARALGWAGYRRVMENFTWEKAAAKTVAAYREAIDDHRRL